jgi:large subunit ribosomal protein L9
VKIILKSDVRDLGRAGELVEVKEGYARNFLLPRSLAVPATVGNLKDFQKRIATAKAREDRERNSAQEVADRLQGKKVVIIHRAVEGSTRIHGSVTAIEIAQALTVLAGKEIERRDVDIRQPIRSLGEYRVNLKLVRGLTVPIQVLVTDREPGEETEAEATEQVEEVAAA